MAGLKSWHFLVLNTRERVSVSFLSPDLTLESLLQPAAGKKAMAWAGIQEQSTKRATPPRWAPSAAQTWKSGEVCTNNQWQCPKPIELLLWHLRADLGLLSFISPEQTSNTHDWLLDGLTFLKLVFLLFNLLDIFLSRAIHNQVVLRHSNCWRVFLGAGEKAQTF